MDDGRHGQRQRIPHTRFAGVLSLAAKWHRAGDAIRRSNRDTLEIVSQLTACDDRLR